MEELRSTEILDKEIQDDARKKAQRILTDADNQCKKILDDVESRIAAVSISKKAFYDGKIAVQIKDAEAAVPLEKERFLVSFEEKAVGCAIDEYLASLSEEKKLLIIKRLLTRYKPAVGKVSFHATVYGFDKLAVEKLLIEEFGKEQIASCENMSDSASLEMNIDSGVIIETTDKKIRCRVTINELVEEILDTYSYELASTLFGGSLPQ